jgi:hypothetical protein
MGGSKLHPKGALDSSGVVDNKELEKARKSMSNYLSGVKKTKPIKNI